MGNQNRRLLIELKQYLEVNRSNLKGDDESLILEIISELSSIENKAKVDQDIGQILIILELVTRLFEVM